MKENIGEIKLVGNLEKKFHPNGGFHIKIQIVCL